MGCGASVSPEPEKSGHPVRNGTHTKNFGNKKPPDSPGVEANGDLDQNPRQNTPKEITRPTLQREVTEFAEEEEVIDNSLTAQAMRFGYPPPKPPTTRKAEIFDIKDYSQIDKHAQKVPPDMLYEPFEELAKYLTKGCETDLQRVRALFIFITSQDTGKIQDTLQRLPEAGTPLDYLLKIKWQMGNHAHFFAQLVRAANIPCLVLTGINKSAAYQVGNKVDRKSMGAQWNAVLVDNQWRLVDAYWASTCVVGKQSSDWALMDDDGEVNNGNDDNHEEDEETMHQVNEFFFLTDPDMLIRTHLPDEADWQLLDQPLSTEDFESMVYIRERFYQIGMTFLPESEKLCSLHTKNGECALVFGIPENLAAKLQYRYLLFRSKQNGEQPPQIPFERFVFYQKSMDAIRYTARFPMKGKFKMDIFGQVEKQHETLDLVCSYLIECNDPITDAQPLPDMPEIGWGPGAEAQNAGLKATTHEGPVIETKDGLVEIRFNMEDGKAFMQNLKNNNLDEALLSKYAMIREENGELIINLRIPNEGEFALNLFVDDANKKGDLNNVCNYLIKVLKGDKNVKPFPKVHDGRLGEGYMAKVLGVKALSHQENIIKAPEGYLTVSFEANDDVEVFCEIHHNDVDRTMLSEGIDKKVDGKTTSFDLSFPTAGEYAMNVFAYRKGDPDRIYHVHSYLIESDKGMAETVIPSKKDAPIVPMYTSNDFAEIRLPSGSLPLCGELRKINSHDTSINQDQLKATKDGKVDLFRVQLPELGEYLFDVYAEKPNGALIHKCTIQLFRHEPEPGQEVKTQREQVQEKPPTPVETLSPEEIERRRKEKELEAKHRACREKLKAAISSQDPVLLKQAIREFEANKVPQKRDELDKAKALLDYLTISQALTTAMSKRSLHDLERALEAAEKAGLQKKLNLQMQMARKILEQLRRIEKLRHEIMNLDQKTIAEIKSYASPPEVVHQVMAGCFMLLGESERKLRDWKQVVVLIGKTGKESLKRRVSEFNVERLKIELALRAKQIFKKYDLDEVRDVSAGAATFYVWSMGMIEECESRFLQEGGDLDTIQVSRPKTGRKKGAKAA